MTIDFSDGATMLEAALGLALEKHRGQRDKARLEGWARTLAVSAPSVQGAAAQNHNAGFHVNWQEGTSVKNR